MHREMLVAVQIRRFTRLEELGRDADASFRRGSNLFELTWQSRKRERGGESGSKKEMSHPRWTLALCNRYGLPMAARSLGEGQETSEAPVSSAILAKRVTLTFAQRTAARRVELKMVRHLRCVSVTGRKGHASSSRLGGRPF